MVNAENMLNKLEEEYYEILMDYYDKQQRIVWCINRLSSIALNGRINSSNEYLDLLIDSENEQKKSGYKERIEGYKELKQENEMIDYIMKKSITQKSKQEIKVELARKMNELKQGEKSTLDKSIQKLSKICFSC
ncbi:hypothetical protein EDI_140270 [Entamoeba dispar SAW760]|uniref:Uncharacterized protein n=1 Tax=Entamoeba dispar (strain ATCC PRA-260 / SAW760) TaxID=370354 RepID=B0EFQ5_ENTDS|nr:uncharacterized protein EDI_140270 [Entamoeba dispar SAW760]EDR26641.1 hypothetical protein EDI_140270 [Entamoeba dispar SAW760]|eukprot:EDR26641.1 hypothetical protein EDI_140270 [Entamoeba dispar SAW760]